MERRRTVRDRQRVLGASDRGELVLELANPRTHAPPSRRERLVHGLDELRVDEEIGERPATRSPWSSSLLLSHSRFPSLHS